MGLVQIYLNILNKITSITPLHFSVFILKCLPPPGFMRIRIPIPQPCQQKIYHALEIPVTLKYLPTVTEKKKLNLNVKSTDPLLLNCFNFLQFLALPAMLYTMYSMTPLFSGGPGK